MAQISLSGYAAQEPKHFGDNTSIRIAEKVYDAKLKERVTVWWEIIAYDPNGKIADLLSDKSKTRFIVANGTLSTKMFNNEIQHSCWTHRDGFTMNITEKGPSSGKYEAGSKPKAPPAETADESDIPF